MLVFYFVFIHLSVLYWTNFVGSSSSSSVMFKFTAMTFFHLHYSLELYIACHWNQHYPIHQTSAHHQFFFLGLDTDFIREYDISRDNVFTRHPGSSWCVFPKTWWCTTRLSLTFFQSNLSLSLGYLLWAASFASKFDFWKSWILIIYYHKWILISLRRSVVNCYIFPWPV